MFRSENLRFHYPTEAECSDIAGQLSDLEVMRLMSPLLPFPANPSDIARRVDSGEPAPFTGAARSYELAISELEGPLGVVGIAGLYGVDLAHSTAEIGVSILNPSCQGRGLGVEAHLRWIRYAFEDLGLERLTGSAKGTNQRAIAVAKRIGMQEEGRLRSHRFVAGQRIDIVLLGILRDEWQSLQ